jgi:exodeoxyribonuclease V alpha subunit
MAILDKVLVITGGPGTGKTTIIHAVIQIFRGVGAKIFLAAPTGRASKRMTEATGHPAGTIHRLLEYSWQKGGFQRNEDRPIEGDVIILDEVSMIDTSLMYHLLKGVPSGATLIMVGDSNQLPSVGPGNVLRDVIRSGTVPVVELKEVFRQARESLIIMNAHRINRGIVPEVKGSGEDPGDFYFIEQGDPDQALNIVMELVLKRIPNRFGLDPMRDIQVLSPMHKGLLGTANLNIKLQSALNPSKKEIVRGDRSFALNDKVMQIRNNYEKEVFNGDIGLIKAIDGEKQEMVVTYDDKPVLYDYLELDEIVLAYAISVHKSQGSEYQAVVLPILPQHYLLLQRNLIYTAVTRAKRLVVIVGSKRALTMGIKNEGTLKRYTYLEERLRS